MDELTEWQTSSPMPARPRSGLVDRDVTEQLGDATPGAEMDRAAAAPGESRPARRPPRTPGTPTQPVGAGPSATHSAPSVAGSPSPALGGPPAPHRPPAAEARNSAAEPSRLHPPRTRVAPGDVLCGRYVVEEKVAHYGMGHVYRALDRHREEAGAAVARVALKFARLSVGGDGETTALLRQEFLKLSRLRHPNIVDAFDIARDGELEFIVMEWLDGETLADLLARITTRRIALDRARDIVRSTARALAHAHDAGIVHGDVKPSNIFLIASRSVKVLDFGSSATATADSERHWATRAYASSEVLDGRPPQARDDVFALGVTAYCLLSGERPFGELDALEAREQGVEPPPLPDDALGTWPAVRRALALDAIDRTGNARLFLQELDDPAVPPPVGAAAPESTPVVYGAVVATALAALVWWSVQGIDGRPEDPAAAALAEADRALAEGPLGAPREESALALYSAVLEAEPDNRRAQDGLGNIADRFVARARDAVAAGNPAAARLHLEGARRARPDHPGISLVEDLLTARGRVALLESRAAAPTKPERAEALLAKAAALLPADDPGLARGRAAIAAQRAENRVGELLARIDERILSERLSVPNGDSALDLLHQARALAPDDPRIPAAADRILTALLFQSIFATSNGDLEEAGNFLSMARSMGIPHLALARAEYELAKAKREALARAD